MNKNDHAHHYVATTLYVFIGFIYIFHGETVIGIAYVAMGTNELFSISKK